MDSELRLIERPRLTQLLQRRLERSHVLMMAPAGYGKSVLLTHLVSRRPRTFHIQLTAADTDFEVLQERLLPLMKETNTIILDDVHLLSGHQKVIDWLSQQLYKTQPRWLIAGRSLPFESRFLAIAGKVSVIDKAEISFTAAETSILLNTDQERAALWQERLDGWSLALSLLARLPDDGQRFPATKQELFHYLTNAVFSQLSADVRRFMTLTAIPLRFNEELFTLLWGKRFHARALFQKVESQNLYLQNSDQPGWLRYHDLIREFLLSHTDIDITAEAQHIISWFLDKGMLDMAIEQAIDAGLEDVTAQLLSSRGQAYYHGNHRYHTLRRWVRSISKPVESVHPRLLAYLSNACLMTEEYAHEAVYYSQLAFAAAELSDSSYDRFMVQNNHVVIEYRQGRLHAGKALLLHNLDSADSVGKIRGLTLRILSLVLGDLGDFNALGPIYDEAIKLMTRLGTRNEPYMNRANRARQLYLRRGKMELARQEIEATLAHFASQPGWLTQYLVFKCDYQFTQGDWNGLRNTLSEILELEAQNEVRAQFNALWLHHYMVALAVAEADEEAYATYSDRYAELSEIMQVGEIAMAKLAVWHARKREDWSSAIQIARQGLATGSEFDFYRAQLALEGDIAAGLAMVEGARTQSEIHDETRRLIGWRARPELLRLQALLAIVAHVQGQPRWKRHFAAVQRHLAVQGLQHSLTRRDPELGAYFWRIALVEGTALAEAQQALLQIDLPEKLYPLLAHNDPYVRERTVGILRLMGHEETLPYLTKLGESENDPNVQGTLGSAIQFLEATPPPLLTMQLMGGFSLQRGDVTITAERWHRPVVLRLCQYFALHAGQPLTREQILNDLWPDSTPAKGWKTFRTVYSLLRKVLEPYLPPKTPNRYFIVARDSHLFGPPGLVDIDLAAYVQGVSSVLRERDAAGGTVSELFLTLLAGYRPVLPKLAQEEWLLSSRQQAQELYIEGCLYAAQIMLQQQETHSAVSWAQRAVTQAPWLEEGYQVLMRAYARQGQRSLALQQYEAALENLQRELDLSPAPLTEWLAERLRHGESI